MKWFVSLVVALGLVAGCSKHAPPPARPPQKVSTVQVARQGAALERQFVGRVSAYQSANVVARVSGVLLDRTYREGRAVRRGQLLFRIDPAYYKAQLDNDLAVLAEDRATLANANVTAQRDHALLPIGSVSQQTVDNADAAARSAEAKVQADAALVEAARVNLGYADVRAPISGIAGQQQVTTGAIVGSGTSDTGAGSTLLTTIEQIDRVYVNFTISAADLVALRHAQERGELALDGQGKAKVAIALPDASPYPQVGTLDFSGVRVNAATGAVDMRAIVRNPARMLLPGMYVRLRVDLGRQDGVFLVPQRALLRDASGAYVLVVGADGKVLRKAVVVGDSVGSDWVIRRGLTDGDRVIVSGVMWVRPGQHVVATAWQPKAPDASGTKH